VEGELTHPILVHFGIRPAQLSYAGDPAYQKAWKQYIKFKHLLNSKPKVWGKKTATCMQICIGILLHISSETKFRMSIPAYRPGSSGISPGKS
jgi:hypothetical protein